MSGGSYNYLYCTVEEWIETIRNRGGVSVAFAEHLVKVAKALHDIEWVDSYDNAKGSEEAAILACLTDSDVLDGAARQLEEMKKTVKSLERAIKKFEGKEK